MSLMRALAVACAFLLAGSLPTLADDRPDLTIAVNDIPGSLEGIEEMGNIAVRITYSVFDTLIRRDFNSDGSGRSSELVPGLATSWERVDSRTLDLTLREGVLFHNGDEFTSDDVVFSLGAGRGHGFNPAIPAADRFLTTLSHVEPLGKYKVRIVSKQPDVMLEQRLAGYAVYMVNAREYLTVGKDAYGRKPIGTGPFKMAEWVDGEFVRLEAHDDYWGGKPTAKQATFTIVPEISARIAGLVSGEYDIAVNIPPDQFSVIEGYDDLKLAQIVLDNTHMLVFHPNGPLEDKRIRQALSLSIDRNLLRQALWNDGNYTPNGHQLPSYVMYMEDYPDFAFDPEWAKALVQETGYQDEEIIYRLPLNYYLLSLEAAQAMQQMWKSVGLNVKLEPVENWTQVRAEGTLIRPWSNTHRMPDPLGSFVPQWGPSSGIQKNKRNPHRSWSAPQAFNDALADIVAKTDMEVRRDAYRKALDLWIDEAPGTMLYNPLETYAMRKSITWAPYSLYYMDLRPDNLSFN